MQFGPPGDAQGSQNHQLPRRGHGLIYPVEHKHRLVQLHACILTAPLGEQSPPNHHMRQHAQNDSKFCSASLTRWMPISALISCASCLRRSWPPWRLTTSTAAGTARAPIALAAKCGLRTMSHMRRCAVLLGAVDRPALCLHAWIYLGLAVHQICFKPTCILLHRQAAHRCHFAAGARGALGPAVNLQAETIHVHH